ncbi:B12-binding domain-containing radical SAM protein [Chlamydiota bacterium]
MSINKHFLLIYPKLTPNWEYVEDDPSVGVPVGLLLIASTLKKCGYNSKIIDGTLYPDYMARIDKYLNDAFMIGLSVMTSQVYDGIKISEYIKKKKPEIPVVWGGIHPSLFPQQTCSDEVVDFVCIGAGEITAVELSDVITRGKDVSNISGIAYKKNGNVYVTAVRQYEDINKLPSLDYDLLEKVEDYINRDVDISRILGGYKRRVLTLLTGLGCPFQCTFCINTVLWQKKQFLLSADRIVEDLERVVSKYGINFIIFRDENFFTKKDRIVNFINKVKEKRLSFEWYANVRANYFSPKYISDNFMRSLKEIGAFRFAMGVESASDFVRQEIIKKGIKLENVVESARLSNKYKVVISYSFMMGVPGETKKDTIKTISFMNTIKKINRYAHFYGPQLYRPYPGSELYQITKGYGFREPFTLRGWGGKSDKYIGYLNPEELKWLDDVKFYELVHLCMPFFFKKISQVRARPIMVFEYIMIIVSRLRMICKFWQCRVEIIAFQILKKFKII